ncbi:hypothetical protein ABN028_09540 [Actinopolymorpha sp. B17G11]|uniref:hypothetical protein n=1 Tax=Actinopolymorpha sp. B17G11 TaxID=3160861 RepID=UPI0032E442E3
MSELVDVDAMDPDATLAELRELAKCIDVLDYDDAIRVVELASALDGWLSGGGILPTPWNRNRT